MLFRSKKSSSRMNNNNSQMSSGNLPSSNHNLLASSGGNNDNNQQPQPPQRSVSPLPVPPPTLIKLGLCTVWIVNGQCPMGDNCVAAHGLVQIPNVTITNNNVTAGIIPPSFTAFQNNAKLKHSLCHGWLINGNCGHSICSFAHGVSELRSLPQRLSIVNTPIICSQQAHGPQPFPIQPQQPTIFPTPPTMKRQKCRFFFGTGCTWGDNCKYSHHSDLEEAQAEKSMAAAAAALLQLGNGTVEARQKWDQQMYFQQPHQFFRSEERRVGKECRN